MIAKTILIKYLEYTCFWETKYGTNNPPSKVLQGQLSALMKSIEIFPNEVSNDQNAPFFDDFKRGMFLEQKTHTEKILTPVLQKYIDEYIEENEHSRSVHNRRNRIDYKEIFNILLSYRIEIERLYIPSGIRFEGSGTLGRRFCNHQKGKILEALTETTKELDDILCLLIDPSQKDIPEEILISTFGYPTEDLRSVATNWFADGF